MVLAWKFRETAKLVAFALPLTLIMQSALAQPAMPASLRGTIDTYCGKCHNADDWAGKGNTTVLTRIGHVTPATGTQPAAGSAPAQASAGQAQQRREPVGGG